MWGKTIILCYTDGRSAHRNGNVDWLDGSGWTYVMTSANVTSDGVIKLQQQLCSFSFTGHMLTINSTHQTMSNDTMMSGASRSRPSIFSLLVQGLTVGTVHEMTASTTSSTFAVTWKDVDHYHYARWMTVHVQYLLALEANCPTTHAHFIKGNFVTQKTTHKLSTLAHDQVLEQLDVKGDG